MLKELGLHVWFRYEKYREEFAHEDVIVAIDETPVGMFVEIEGSEAGIDAMAGRSAAAQSDYILDSYRGAVPQAPRGVRPRPVTTWCSTHRMPAAEPSRAARAAPDGRPRHAAAAR